MTIKDIARLAGVSISTVSKIVNDKADNINIETRNRVLKIVKEYHYTPYGSAKSISSAKTFVIGVLLNQAGDTTLMLNGIIAAAQKHGYHVLVCDSMGSLETELKHITALCGHKVDGVVWEPVGKESLACQRYFKEQNILVSYINTPLVSNAFSLDFSLLGYTAAQKLIDCRHSRIGCLTKPGSLRSSLVFEGFKKCLFDNEIPYTEDMRFSVLEPDYHTRIFLQGFTGILSTHFESALDLYEKADRFHYLIPWDFSLISLRKDAREPIHFPRISSIRIPYERFGSKVCENLISRCEKQTPPPVSPLIPDDLNLDHQESLDTPPACRYKKILVVGSINTDITLNVEDLPKPGSTTIITASATTPGGKGANQAIGAAKLGREVAIIGKIGGDYDSALIYDTLKKEKVLTLGLRRDTSALTGKAYIHVQKDAESSITILPGANQNLSPSDILSKESLFDGCGYCLISTEIPKDTFLQAVLTARAHGAKTIVKPAALSRLPQELLSRTDIFVPNKNEAESLCPKGLSVEEQAEFFFREGCPVVIITLGHKGCYVKTESLAQAFPAASFPSVDSTGGADAFIAALAVYLTEGHSLANAVQIASYAAGFCVSRTGVIPALIDRASLENHIKLAQPELLTGP